jgi:hypothetical protein
MKSTTTTIIAHLIGFSALAIPVPIPANALGCPNGSCVRHHINAHTMVPPSPTTLVIAAIPTSTAGAAAANVAAQERSAKAPCKRPVEIGMPYEEVDCAENEPSAPTLEKCGWIQGMTNDINDWLKDLFDPDSWKHEKATVTRGVQE